MQKNTVAISIWIIIFMAVLIWSGIGPKDRVTWMLEVAPAVVGFIALAITYKQFPLTPLLYVYFNSQHHTDCWRSLHLC